MSALLRRVAPGMALAGTALALVVGFDEAVHPAVAPSAGGTEAPGAGTTGSCTDATEYTGEAVTTQWGPVQVVARVGSDGKVCDSEAVVHPTGDHRSVQINDYALPVIDQAVLDQGVEFDAVSGATVTSEGYRQSLQSILDSL